MIGPVALAAALLAGACLCMLVAILLGRQMDRIQAELDADEDERRSPPHQETRGQRDNQGMGSQ